MSACTGECTQCDDGLTGSGTCLGTTTDSVKGGPHTPAFKLTKGCKCLHGTCTSDNTCTCAAGWITNSTTGDLCGTCAIGFFQTKSGNCSGRFFNVSRSGIRRLTISLSSWLFLLYTTRRDRLQSSLYGVYHSPHPLFRKSTTMRVISIMPRWTVLGRVVFDLLKVRLRSYSPKSGGS